MARTEPVSAQPLPGSEGAGTITIDVAAKLLMVTPEWVRRLAKEGWIAKTERGRYRVVDVVQGYVRFLSDRTDDAHGPAANAQSTCHVLAHPPLADADGSHVDG